MEALDEIGGGRKRFSTVIAAPQRLARKIGDGQPLGEHGSMMSMFGGCLDYLNRLRFHFNAPFARLVENAEFVGFKNLVP